MITLHWSLLGAIVFGMLVVGIFLGLRLAEKIRRNTVMTRVIKGLH